MTFRKHRNTERNTLSSLDDDLVALIADERPPPERLPQRESSESLEQRLAIDAKVERATRVVHDAVDHCALGSLPQIGGLASRTDHHTRAVAVVVQIANSALNILTLPIAAAASAASRFCALGVCFRI